MSATQRLNRDDVFATLSADGVRLSAAGAVLWHREGKFTALVAFSNAGDLLAVEGPRRTIRLLRMNSGRAARTLVQPKPDYWGAGIDTCRAGAFSPDDRHLVVIKEVFTGRFGHVDQDFYSDGLLVWDTRTGAYTCCDRWEESEGFVHGERLQLLGFTEEGHVQVTRARSTPPQRETRRLPDLSLVSVATEPA